MSNRDRRVASCHGQIAHYALNAMKMPAVSPAYVCIAPPDSDTVIVRQDNDSANRYEN